MINFSLSCVAVRCVRFYLQTESPIVCLTHPDLLCDDVRQTTANDGWWAVKDGQTHTCGRQWADSETPGWRHESRVYEVCQEHNFTLTWCIVTHHTFWRLFVLSALWVFCPCILFSVFKKQFSHVLFLILLLQFEFCFILKIQWKLGLFYVTSLSRSDLILLYFPVII